MTPIESHPVVNPLARWTPSPNFDTRHAPIDTIVLHHTACHTADSAMATLESHNPHGRVSAHYLVARDGTIYQLVEESRRAWHAGAGSWKGRGDLNSRSIGIELDNDGTEPFAGPLIESLLLLLDDLVRRLRIPRDNIVGHADIAPGRKVDPSVQFPWGRLGAHGFGLWPSQPLVAASAQFDPDVALRAIGYDLTHRPAAIAAFHRHFTAHEGTAFSAADFDLLHTLQLQSLSAKESA